MNYTSTDSFKMFPQTLEIMPNTSCDAGVIHCTRNVSGSHPPLPSFTTAAKIRVIITVILCVFSACCNLAVLGTAKNNSKRKSHVRLLISNLAVADLLVTFIVMPLDAVWNVTVQWLAGDLTCRFLMFLKLMAMYSCAFVTVVISLDRQSAILNPLAINKAKRRNKIMLTIAWTMSAALSIPQAFLFHIVTISTPGRFTQCTTHGSFTLRWQETLYNMLTFCFLFLFPLIIMISCYTRILLEISRGMTKDNISSNGVHLRCSTNNIPKARMRTLKMSMVIVLSFVVCWTPYYLLGLWYWFSPVGLEETVSHSLSHILFLFGLFNACLDPVIYGLFTVPPRQRCRSNVPLALEMETTNTVVMESFRCSSSSLSFKRPAAQTTGFKDRDKRPSHKHIITTECSNGHKDLRGERLM